MIIKSLYQNSEGLYIVFMSCFLIIECKARLSCSDAFCFTEVVLMRFWDVDQSEEKQDKSNIVALEVKELSSFTLVHIEARWQILQNQDSSSPQDDPKLLFDV